MQPLPDRGQPYAVVIGLDDGLTGIQTARILARRGVPTVAIAGDPSHFCCKTNVCERILFARTKDESLIAALVELGPQLPGKAVLFPCQDVNVQLVSQHRAALAQWYHIILSPPDVIEMMMDKGQFYRFAREHGFPVPCTYVLESRVEAEHAATMLDYPCILKPSNRSPEWNNHTRMKAFLAEGPDDLLALYDRYRPWTDVLIAQQWIAGGDREHYACNCYFDAKGQPVLTYVTRKIRQWPPGTGQGCSGEACENDVVRAEALRLYQHVGCRGLGYVEMKRDVRTGHYFIIEPNIGRPTGRSATADAAGVELMYTLYCDALGWPLPQGDKQTRLGMKWVYLRQDLQSAVHYWRRGELSPREWWQSLHGPKTFGLWDWRDPLPFLSDWVRVFRLAFFAKEKSKAFFKM